MARAITAQQGGFELQALLFFIQACRLVHPHEEVQQVGFEVSGAEGFDDIQVSYNDPIPDGRGGPCTTDYEQVKYRVTHHGQVTADDLTRPEFIGATSESLLQKVHRLQQRHAPDGTGCRLILRQPYPFEPDDPLASLVEKREGYLRLETLFDGKERSRMAELRRRWREHLGVDDEGLRLALMPLRLRHDPRTLDDVRTQLNKDLVAAGLEPVAAGQLTSPYEQLPWKLAAAAATGEVRLDHGGLVTLMREQGLYRGPPLNTAPTRRLGLRSYASNADYIERDTEAHLCCLNHFEDRVIRDPDLWKTHVHHEITAFLERELRPGEHVHLCLEAHYSVVFAAGRATARSSARVWPVQFGEVWKVGARLVPPSEPLWDFHEEPVGTGEDIVVAVSVSQDVRGDVRRAVAEFPLPAAVLLEATVLPGVGRQAVLGADHAYLLAQALIQHVQRLCARVGRGRRIHLFVSLPKALMFFLGQEARTLRNLQLYEFDGAYLPALLID